MHSFDSIAAQFPEELRKFIQHRIFRVLSKYPTIVNDELYANRLQQLAKVLNLSDYAMHSLQLVPDLITEIFKDDFLAEPVKKDIQLELENILHPLATIDSLLIPLRLYKHAFMLKIMLLDLNGLIAYSKLQRMLANFAEIVIKVVLDKINLILTAEYGMPYDPFGNTQQLAVIALGKLGGEELNFSSDIDLIFSYFHDGNTTGAKKSIENKEYFTKIAQKLIYVLSHKIKQGFVFRVDMRLRPYGNSGPLVVSSESLVQYYQAHGRNWERYAWVKARLINISKQGLKLLNNIKPFMYRRYVDYSIFESLREMKLLIEQNLSKKNYQHDIKRGAGGIRQIEFIVQSFQLIRGGKEPAFQSRNVLVILNRLMKRNYLQVKEATTLYDSYIFLRRLENRIQMRHDRQTHILPTNANELLKLAFSMGFNNVEEFFNKLNATRLSVAQLFDHISAIPDVYNEVKDTASTWSDIWQGKLSKEITLNYFSEQGFQNSELLLDTLLQYKHSNRFRGMTEVQVSLVNKIIPKLLSVTINETNPDHAFKNALNILHSISKRSAYLALLYEHPELLRPLTVLCGRSTYLARILARHPVLLDELLMQNSPKHLQSEHLYEELKSRMQWFEGADIEERLHCLSQFKLANSFKLAKDELQHNLKWEDASTSLTHLASVILEEILKMALDELYPAYKEQKVQEFPFLIVGYGTLGASELNYQSDLDIVFLFDEYALKAYELGCTPSEFSIKLAQKIIRLMQIETITGKLYNIDTRLRPSGNAGLLVSEIHGFSEYQVHEAWMWEHQAVVKARPIIGSELLTRKFNELRDTILSTKRDPTYVLNEVTSMKEKYMMDKKLSYKERHIKQSLMYIDFMLQYYVLSFTNTHHSLKQYQNTNQLLHALGQLSLMSKSQNEWLCVTFNQIQQLNHYLYLGENLSADTEEALKDMLEHIAGIWPKSVES